VSGFGTEVSFRLEPGRLDEARAIAARLAAAAAGCRRHVLFANPDAGEYGCLAEWDARADAAAFGDRPAVRDALADLAERTGAAPRVRLYDMEEQAPGPS
jgi:quinol monooxygenase YgiN